MTLFRAFWLIFLPVLIAIRLTWVCSADALSFGRISISQFQAIEHMLFYFQPVLLAASSYLVWRAPYHGENRGWVTAARAATTLVTVSACIPVVLLALISLAGFKDS